MAFVLVLGWFLFSPSSGDALETFFSRTSVAEFFCVKVSGDELSGVPANRIRAVAKSPDLKYVVCCPVKTASMGSDAQRKACYANQRVILGAIEMYNMDHERGITDISSSTLRQLKEQSYFREIPKGPSLRCKYINQGDLTGNGQVACSLHGSVNDSPATTGAAVTELHPTPNSRGLEVYGVCESSGERHLLLMDRETGKMILEHRLPPATIHNLDPDVGEEWLRFFGWELLLLKAQTPGESVFSYILSQIGIRFQLTPKPAKSPGLASANRSRLPPGQQPDLYSLTTGALAIQESLQLDRMMSAQGSREPPEFSLAELSGPTIKSHPFTEMVGSRRPSVYAIDYLVPEDFYACHFSDINRQIGFGDLLDNWGSSLLNTMDVSAHNSGIREKLQTQLCLATSDLSRLLGAQAIADLTFCGADPFIHEGTDFSIIFTIKNRLLFDTNAARNFSAARTRFPGVTEKKEEIEGASVISLTTADRTVHSFSCDLGEFKVYSNSRAAISRIIRVFQKKAPSLGNAPEFKYIRTIFPAEPKREDFFLYLSDSHIRRLVGPAWKIARQRRIQCINSLRILQNAVSFHDLDRGPEAVDIAGLCRDGFLDREYLHCPDGGEYHLDPRTREPHCTAHGHLRAFLPILEQVPTRITKSERDEYKLFLDGYNRYWVEFFDPIGIRGVFSDKGVELDTCILPLLENSTYNSFKAFSGGEAAELTFPVHPKTILQLVFRINPDLSFPGADDFRRGLDDVAAATSFSGQEILAQLDGGFSLNLLDGDSRFSFDMLSSGGGMPFFLRSPADMLGIGFLLSSLNMPVYAVIKVKDEAFFDRLLSEWLLENHRRRLDRSNHGMFRGPEVSYYHTMTEDQQKIHTVELVFFILKWRVFFAVKDGNLVMASQRRIIPGLLNSDTAQQETVHANLAVRFFFDAYEEFAEESGLSWQGKIRQACVNNLGSLHALHFFRKIPREKWQDASLAVNGYFPYCPAGGEYSVDSARKQIRCSVHLGEDEFRQPYHPDSGQPLQQFVDRLKRLETTLKFTPEGIMTSVRILY
jgi:competence protein ComGC